jgi:hypothetical protein
MVNDPASVWETNESHYEIFKSECNYWIERYGLIGWEIHFDHSIIDKSRASCVSYGPGRMVALTLGTEWHGLEPTPESIGKTAYHEVCELLLADLVEAATNRKFDADDLEAKTHAIIRTLENVHWPEREAYLLTIVADQ